jgi:2-C-methyl-D-erythritol 4-phosphate cytidylyltransferase
MTSMLGAIIVAAGSGERMGGADKLFTEVAGRPLLAHAIAPFQEFEAISAIVLVLSTPNLKRGRELVEQHGFSKAGRLVAGGERRRDSVAAGLEALSACDYVCVHDGARPLAGVDIIERGLAAVQKTGAAVPAVRIVDTVKQANDDGLVTQTIDRSRLWAVQTPQFFRRDLLERAHRETTSEATDDAAMVEALGEPVRIFAGDARNVKVTVAEDLEVVRAVLERTVGQRI